MYKPSAAALLAVFSAVSTSVVAQSIPQAGSVSNSLVFKRAERLMKDDMIAVPRCMCPTMCIDDPVIRPVFRELRLS